MNPWLALSFTLVFVLWLLRRDLATRRGFSTAIWIPQIWLLVRGSRPISFWFGGGISLGSTADYTEGSPIDRLFAFALMGVALIVLQRRRLDWGRLISQNRALVALFLFYGLSTLWSDFPFVSFKRWIKECGSVCILLVLLTEKNPIDAIKAVFFRCACVCFPLSVPLYKYFPAIGRAYGVGGGQQVTGVTVQKNDLGEICATFGLILLWELLGMWKRRKEREDEMKLFYPRLAILVIGGWLLVACDSQTSLLCALFGAFVLLSNRIPLVRKVPKLVVIGGLVILPAILLGLMEYQVGSTVVESIGRDMTFTGRTQIWEMVLSLQTHPVLGSGFYSFWLGNRGQFVWDNFTRLTTAHSGYIETYLDGGYVGVFILLSVLMVVGCKLSRKFLSDTDFGRVRFAVFIMTIVLNFSESSFYHLSVLWLMFLLLSLDVPEHSTELVAVNSGARFDACATRITA